jgi:hypothetical protein
MQFLATDLGGKRERVEGDQEGGGEAHEGGEAKDRATL